MRVEDAIRIVDNFSANIRNGLSESHILKVGSVISEFDLKKQYRNIGGLFRALERYPQNRVVADSLARHLQKILIFYMEKRDPFIVKPSAGDFNGEIVIARCGSTDYNMTFKEACLHLFASGRTGSGKTTLLMNLFRALNRLGIRCIWVDTRKKSGRNLIREFPNTVVLQFKYDSQFRFNIIKSPPGVEIQRWRSTIAEVLSTTMETYLGTRNFFLKHLTEVMKMDAPYFGDLYRSVQNDKISYHKNPRQISQQDGARGRLTAIINELSPVLNCLESHPIPEIFQDNNLVVEATDLSTDVRLFIVEGFLAWLFCWLEKQPNPEQTLKHFIFIDEGNDVFGANIKGKNEVLLNLMRTIRSAGCGVGLGCQNVSMVEQEVLNNVYSRIMLSMCSGVDITTMARSMMFTKEQIEAIFRIQEFEGIVRTPNFPELFRITIDPHFLPDVSDAEVVENNERILSNFSYVPLPSDVLEIREEVLEIDGSEEKEQKKEESKNTINEQKNEPERLEVADDEKRLLLDVYNRPYEPISRRCESLGLSGSVRKRIIKSIVEKKLAIELPIKTGHGRGETGKILVLTDKAESAIEPAQKMKYGRSAILHHSHVQEILKYHLQNLWDVKTEIEMFRNGKHVDVAITKNDGTAVAVEYEKTPSHVKQNIEKDLAAGFEKVITVCGKNQVLKEIKKIVDEELSREKERVSICLLKDVLTGRIEI